MSRGLGRIQRAIINCFDDGSHPGPVALRVVDTAMLIEHVYGVDSPAARAGISRALRRLQEERLIRSYWAMKKPAGYPGKADRHASRIMHYLTKRGTKRFGLYYCE